MIKLAFLSFLALLALQGPAYAGSLGRCETAFKNPNRSRMPSEEIARELRSWKPIKFYGEIRELPSTFKAYLQIGTGPFEGVFGEITRVSAEDGTGSIVALKDRRGALHVFTESSIKYILRAPENISDTTAKRLQDSISGTNIMLGNRTAIDPVEFQTAWARLSNEQRSLLESNGIRFPQVTENGRTHALRRAYLRLVMWSGIAQPATWFFWGFTVKLREAGYGQFLLNHASNFYFGIAGMAMVHPMVAFIMPKYRSAAIVAAGTVMTYYNYYRELSPHEDLDIPDFVAGQISVVVYTLAALAFDAHVLRRYREQERAASPAE